MSNTAKLNSCPKCGLPIPAGAPQGLCPKCVLQGAATATESGLPATATSEIPSLERVAAAFPQLEILELIGRGGMGFVFKARQPHLERFVALKLLPDRLARDPRFAERFNREGRVLARLNHPNIVGVYDFGMTEHFYFLMMEYVDGVNLRQAMQAGRFSPAESLGIVPRICEALQYAHDQGILHRDIKPENILLDARGQVKIADFGIAKLLGDDREDVTLTATGSTLGTAHYMAPEQVEKPSEVDHRADIYSLGVVFYEMLTGELPLGRFAAPSSKTPVSAGVDQVVFRTLEKDRELRFQTAGEVGTQVEHLTQTGGTTPEAPSSAGALTQAVWSRRSFWSAGLVAVALAMPLLALSTGTGSESSEPFDAVLLLLASVVPGMFGTLLGWTALSEIRASAGRLLGLPLAVFAAVAWPVTLLVLGTVSTPWLALIPMGVDGSVRHSWLLVRLVPAAMITFAIWAVYATVRWANRMPAGPRRGVLKWVFLGLVISGFGITPLKFPPISRHGRAESPTMRVALTVPRGQAATLQIMRREGADSVPVSELSGFLVSSDEERGRGSVVLKPVDPLPKKGGARSWRLAVESEEGGRSESGWADLGELSPIPSNSMRVTVEPDSSTEIMLTRPNETGEAGVGHSHPVLTLRISSQARGSVGGAQGSITVGAGSTNWATNLLKLQSARRGAAPRRAEILADPSVKPGAQVETSASVRFTFTNVASREEAGVRWIGFDYAAFVMGDCEETFRMTGVSTTTRNTGLLISPAGTPAIRHQRFEWQVPAGTDLQTVSDLVEAFSKALVGRSWVIASGEERPLLRLPVGKSGDLTVHIGAIARAR